MAVEAPLSPGHGSAIVDAIATLAPGQPITHLIQSHHHVDHASGVRSLVAAGVTVVVGDGVGPFWSDVLSAPSTIRPDALARSGATPTVEVIDADRSLVVVDDDDLTVTAYHLEDAVHASDMVITLIETDGQRFVYVADLYSGGLGFNIVLGGPESFFAGMRDAAIIDKSCDSALPLTIVSAHGIPLSLEEVIAELDGLGVDVGCS